jgi:hypothetical protein
MKKHFRIWFLIFFTLLAFFLLLYSIDSFSGIKLEEVNVFDRFLWSLGFTFLGFCLLVLKICINNIGIEKEGKELQKDLLRYCLFYPILIIVLSVLSVSYSINKFNTLDKTQYFIASALLSFFLGFFIDSILNVMEKLNK